MAGQHNQKWDSDDETCKRFHCNNVVKYILVDRAAKHVDTQNAQRNVEDEGDDQAMGDCLHAYFFGFYSKAVVGWEEIHLKGIGCENDAEAGH